MGPTRPYKAYIERAAVEEYEHIGLLSLSKNSVLYLDNNPIGSVDNMDKTAKELIKFITMRISKKLLTRNI